MRSICRAGRPAPRPPFSLGSTRPVTCTCPAGGSGTFGVCVAAPVTGTNPRSTYSVRPDVVCSGVSTRNPGLSSTWRCRTSSCRAPSYRPLAVTVRNRIVSPTGRPGASTSSSGATGCRAAARSSSSALFFCPNRCHCQTPAAPQAPPSSSPSRIRAATRATRGRRALTQRPYDQPRRPSRPVPSHRPYRAGRVAQRKSTRLTSGGSLVRTQPRPPFRPAGPSGSATTQRAMGRRSGFADLGCNHKRKESPVLRQVAEGVLVHESEFMQSNAIVVRGETGVLLVDAGILDSEMVALANDLRELGQPVTAGFSTHPHWDHLLWHASLGEAPRYGTARCAAAIHARLSAPAWKDFIPTLIPPDIVEQVPLDLLGLISGLPAGATHIPWEGPEVRIIEHQAHAPGHAALLIEESGVLVAGDMLSDILI